MGDTFKVHIERFNEDICIEVMFYDLEEEHIEWDAATDSTMLNAYINEDNSIYDYITDNVREQYKAFLQATQEALTYD